MSTFHDTAAVAAFFMKGLVEDITGSRYSNLLKAWGHGSDTLVRELTQYSQYCWDLSEAAWNALTEGFPGVYDYEVCVGFGTWFGDHLAEYKKAPSSDEAHNKILELAKEFFSQSSDSEREAVMAALDGVQR